eukprot:UN05136
MENLSLHDYCEENDEDVDETLLWKDFGRIPLVTTAKEIKLGYSDFNKLEECANFVNCQRSILNHATLNHAISLKQSFPNSCKN